MLYNTYVYNISFSNNYECNMCSFLTESINVMKTGSFHLRQWASNSKQLMKNANELDFADNNSIVKGNLNTNKIDFVWPRNHISSLKKYLKILDTPCSHK